MNHFLNIDYLKTGTYRQKEAYKELTHLEIFEKLAQYKPLLAGTIPIEVDLPSSDLDIICTCKNHVEFSENLINLFGKHTNFKIKTKLIDKVTTTIATFDGNKFPIEIFGQNLDSQKQNAFMHMLVEYQILKKQDSSFKKKIINLKRNGMTTEEAFARLLGIEGDPYKELLKHK